MNKAFDFFLWENYPSINTELDEYHLNKQNNAINEIDNRVLTMDRRIITINDTKADKTELSNLFSDFSYDKNTGILTFTRKNGSKLVIDTPMEKIALNIYYDQVSEKIIMPLIDGESFEVDLSKLITQNEFLDSDTIYFSVENKEDMAFDGIWSSQTFATGMSQGSLYQKEYKSITIESTAEISNISGTYRKKGNETDIPIDFVPRQSDPKHIYTAIFAEGMVSFNIVAETEDEIKEDAEKKRIKGYYSRKGCVSASIKEGSIEEKHLRPDYLAEIKVESKKAEESVIDAGKKAKESYDSALMSKSYSDGDTGIREGESTDNAKYYSEEAKKALDSLSEAGTVTGIKGNAETSYRKGNVNLTSANIGAVSTEYMNEHFVPGYVTSIKEFTGSRGVGWYRIAKAKNPYYNSCVISLKRTYNSPGPEYQKIQLINTYYNHKFVSLAACSDSHIWTKIRETWDEEKTEAYIEVYLSYVHENNGNYLGNWWLISIEDAINIAPNDGWKTIIPTKSEETVNGVEVLASLDLPANFDLDSLARADECLKKTGDTLSDASLIFANSSRVEFPAPTTAGGQYGKGIFFTDETRHILGGIGMLGELGNYKAVYAAVGTDTPWSVEKGIYATKDDIKWKGSKILTESSGNAVSATKATQDSYGNVIKDTYAKKSIYGDTTVSMGRKSGTTVGTNSFAYGISLASSGTASHAEGYNTTASGNYSHTEGYNTAAIVNYSHAEGNNTTASGTASHAEGNNTTASEMFSHAEGSFAEASGMASHAEGYSTKSSNYASHASGKFNKDMNTGGGYNTQKGDAFVIGNGTSSSACSNALRVTFAGDILGTKAFQSSGADYAEFIKPWADGNPNGEDRVGYFVTVKDGLLYKANENDYILGITSGNPSVVGNADEDYYWRYERDEFNRIVMEDVLEMVKKTDENGNLIFDEETHEPIMEETGNIIRNARMKLSDNYDPSLQDSYIPRAERKEWDYVGMVGVLPVRDDGTCIPGCFCRCWEGGIATLAEERGFDTYIVIERISENVVSMILK